MNYQRLPEIATLAERATQINLLLLRAQQAEGQMGRRRWEAGIELLAAQAVIPRGEWQAWVEANIARSVQDCAKLMKMACQDDPEAAHAAEIEAQQDARAVAKSQEHASMRANTMPQHTDEDPAETIVRAWMALDTATQQRAFKRIIVLMEMQNAA